MPEIVVGLTNSAGSRGALRWALQQAQLTGAQLTAVHVWQPKVHLELTPDRCTVTALAESLDASPGAAPPMTVVGLGGQPGPALVARASGADLLVVAGKHRMLPHGSVCEYCLRHGCGPLAIIPDVLSRGGTRPPYIVVGIDLTPAAAPALRWAAQQAQASGANLIMLHSWQVAARSLHQLSHLTNTRQLQQDDHQQRAQSWVDGVLGPTPTERGRLIVEHGAPLDHLLRWADHANVLVLPAAGHHLTWRLLSGTTAGQLAHLRGCPIVVVPAATSAAPTADTSY